MTAAPTVYPSPGAPLSVPASNPSCATPENKGIHSSASRLLYRGALSLPDSLLMLDGLTFTAHLDTSDKSASKSELNANLLQNPLALALQSMRGRPSLRFLGTLRLKDVYLDDSGDVEMSVGLFYLRTMELTVSNLQGDTSYGCPIQNLFREYLLFGAISKDGE